MSKDIAAAIRDTLISPNVCDSNGEDAGVVDVIDRLARNAGKVADAITPSDAVGSHDDSGGYVSSLTEAVMSMTRALNSIASAIQRVAQAVETHA